MRKLFAVFLPAVAVLCSFVAPARADDFTLTNGVDITLTFSLPSSPTPSVINAGNLNVDGFAINNVSYVLDGLPGVAGIGFITSGFGTDGGFFLGSSIGVVGGMFEGETSILIGDDILVTGGPITPTFRPGVYTEDMLGSSGLYTLTITDPSAPSVVPEPSSLLLLGTGFLGLAGLGRHRFFVRN